MIKLYGNYKSGNVYKVSLALNLLGLEYQEVQIGLGPDSESQSAEYKAINPLGQIPVLEVEGEGFISQSNAILYYLSKNTSLFPEDRFAQAKVMQWLFFEQYEFEPNFAWARWITHLMGLENERKDDLAKYHRQGYAALSVLENQLIDNQFIAGDFLSIADVALYAYTHNCEQGGFSLEKYPAVSQWLARIGAAPGYFPMSKQFEQFDY